MDYTNKCQFTVVQIFSKRLDSNSINHWLTEWSRNSIINPNLVVTDKSLALMMAVVKTFTRYLTLSKYISVCSSLILKESIELLTCMIRNYFNHSVHIISTWAEIKSCTFRIKNFYLRSIALVIASTDFNYINILLKNIFTVSLNEEDSINSENLHHVKMPKLI